jgi:hypothetical protein
LLRLASPTAILLISASRVARITGVNHGAQVKIKIIMGQEWKQETGAGGSCL